MSQDRYYFEFAIGFQMAPAKLPAIQFGEAHASPDIAELLAPSVTAHHNDRSMTLLSRPVMEKCYTPCQWRHVSVPFRKRAVTSFPFFRQKGGETRWVSGTPHRRRLRATRRFVVFATATHARASSTSPSAHNGSSVLIAAMVSNDQ